MGLELEEMRKTEFAITFCVYWQIQCKHLYMHMAEYVWMVL